MEDDVLYKLHEDHNEHSETEETFVVEELEPSNDEINVFLPSMIEVMEGVQK